jgi:hypothetical protein
MAIRILALGPSANGSSNFSPRTMCDRYTTARGSESVTLGENRKRSVASPAKVDYFGLRRRRYQPTRKPTRSFRVKDANFPEIRAL